jgi:hypothetical protein
MHDALLAAVFVAMVLLPCLVSMRQTDSAD